VSFRPPSAASVFAKPRRLTAMVTAIALALAPVVPGPIAGVANAQNVLPAPIVLPELGDSSQSMMTPIQERKLGEAIVRQIRAGGGYLNDP
jgi:predicted Zn-dependent protease